MTDIKSEGADPIDEEAIVEAGQSRFFFAEIGNADFAFETVRFDDPKVTAAQIAGKAGAHPVADFRILQQLKSGEIETLRLTETADLEAAGLERFFVIRSDRTFDFTIDGLQIEWPLETILGRNLRILARASEHQDLVLVTPEGFLLVENDQTISFSDKVTEEFRLIEHAKTVTVYYREEPFELERRGWTTEELMAKFKVPAGYKLDLIEPTEFKELKPGQVLHVRDGMEFTSHAPIGQSS